MYALVGRLAFDCRNALKPFLCKHHAHHALNPQENNHKALKWKLDTHRSTEGEWDAQEGNPEGQTRATQEISRADAIELNAI